MATKATDEFKEENRPRSSDQSTHNFEEEPQVALNKISDTNDNQKNFSRRDGNHKETDSKQ